MTLKNCITGKAAAGLVRGEDAARVAQLFDELAADARGRGSANPEAEAGLAVRAAEARRREARKRGALQTMKAQLEADGRLVAAAGAFEDARPGRRAAEIDEAAMSVLAADPRRVAKGESVEGTANGVRAMALARMTEVVERLGSKAGGLDDLSPRVREDKRAGERAIVKELFGESTGDAAAHAAARGWAEAAELLRRSFNGAGGFIPKRADWGLPQTWSRRKLNSVAQDDWVEDAMRELDLARMIDNETGLPFAEAKLRRVLGEVYQDIVTDGLRDVGPQGFVSRGNLAVRRSHARFLVFRDADAWLRMHAKYGEGTVFEAMLSHVNGMARDIALMRHLGATPDATIRFIERRAGELKGASALRETGGAGARAVGRIKGRPPLRDVYAAVSGQLFDPGNEAWAGALAANRNILASSRLGGAIFSALADMGLMSITARLNGVPVARTVARQVRLFNPASGADRRLAERAGFVNETALGTVIGASRHIGEVVGPAWSKRIADTVLRVTGLTPWTHGTRTAFNLEFLGALTDRAGLDWAALGRDPGGRLLRRSMEANGVTEGDWNLFRETRPFRDPETGAEIIRVNDVIGEAAEEGGLFQRRFEAASRINAMILTETEFASPRTSARVQAITSFGLRPGTLGGEVARNAALFKSFPIYLAMMHLRRMIAGDFTPGEKALYAAHLFIGMTVMGALGEQLATMAKGRDPMPMDEEDIWMKGMARGGGLGIFGDFIFASENRFGGSLADTLAGPVFGSQLPQAANLTAGNLLRLARGDDTNAGRELIRFAKLMTPGQTAWQATLALDRLVFDTIQRLADPDAAASFRARERFFEREFGQPSFAPPGRGFPPERGPDFSRLIGG